MTGLAVEHNCDTAVGGPESTSATTSVFDTNVQPTGINCSTGLCQALFSKSTFCKKQCQL